MGQDMLYELYCSMSERDLSFLAVVPRSAVPCSVEKHELTIQMVVTKRRSTSITSSELKAI